MAEFFGSVVSTVLVGLLNLLWVVIFFWFMRNHGPDYPNWLPWLVWVVSFEADLTKVMIAKKLK